MPAHRSIGRLVAASSLLLVTALALPTDVVDGGWDIARATLVPGSSVRPSRISLSRGIALRDDIALRDGTIEVMLEAPSRSQFAGLVFRGVNAANYEIVYFSGDGGRWRDVQYQPLFDGEPTWQLYPGASYHASLRDGAPAPGRAMHVRLVFSGTRADLYVDHDTTPILRIAELKRTVTTGAVGVWAAAPGATSMTFDGFAASRGAAAALAAVSAPAPGAGQIMSWRVSRRLPSPDTIAAPSELTEALRAALGSATDVTAESDGLVNLSRIVGNPAGPQTENVFGGAGWGLALARTTLVSERARTLALRFGYSEGIGVFLNGRRVYAGTNPYSTPELGRVFGDANVIALPLAAGENDLVLAVTDRAFGWGFRARLDSARSGPASP